MVVEPEGTADRATFKAGRIPWCKGTFAGPVWEWKRVKRGLHSAITGIERGTAKLDDPYLASIEHACQWPDDPSWQRQATYLVQAVMNAQKVAQDEAVVLVRTWIAEGQARRDKASRPQTDEDRFAFHESSLAPVAPTYGVATAKIAGAIPWCDKVTVPVKDRWEPGRIDRTLTKGQGIDGLIEGAYHLCQRPTDATWRQRATAALQQWMNWTKQTQDAAVHSLRTRVQLDTVKREAVALCKALEIGAEVVGEAKAFAHAHQTFFGCTTNGEELWRNQSLYTMTDPVGFYLDSQLEVRSEIVRMYWLFGQTTDPTAGAPLPATDTLANVPLLQYAVAARDLAELDDKAIAKQLAAAPFNDFARAVVSESLAVLRWRRTLFEEAIDKLVKTGAEYAGILRKAPQRGFAQWAQVIAPWKAEIARSNAFESKLSDPSRKALAGCAKELVPDVHKLIRSYKAADYHALLNAVAIDPVAQLLLSRLAVCFTAENVHGAVIFKDLVAQGRDLRGPRSLAYYAVVDALTEAMKARPNLLVGHANFLFRMPRLIDIYDGQPWRSSGSLHDLQKAHTGHVEDVTASQGTVRITFRTQKVMQMQYACQTTDRPIRITADGRIEYERRCKEAGFAPVDVTPPPITISSLLAAGVKPNAYIAARDRVVLFVATSPRDKRIQTFLGFAL
jgi:hypothetical protein